MSITLLGQSAAQPKLKYAPSRIDQIKLRDEHFSLLDLFRRNEMSRPKVFLSYAHPDKVWQVRLGKHLGVLEKLGLLEVWSDTLLRAGTIWRPTILGAIESAQVAVMLLSVDFLGSDFILRTEVPWILKRWRAGQIQVVPVLVRACTWEEVPWLAELQMRPWNAVPLAAHKRHRREAELTEIAREIRRLAGMSVQLHPD